MANSRYEHSHEFHGSYSVRDHLNMKHAYIESTAGYDGPTSELMAIHRELHHLRAMEVPQIIIKSEPEPERIPWYFRVWPR